MSAPNVRHATCRHCANPISQEMQHGRTFRWRHDRSDKIKCIGILGGEHLARPTAQYEAAQIDDGSERTS